MVAVCFLKYFRGENAQGKVCFGYYRLNLKIRRGYFWEKRPPQYFVIFGIKNRVFTFLNRRF